MARCKECGAFFFEGTGAVSRKDNKTEICSDCGNEEAWIDIAKAIIKKEEEKINENAN